jgi:hypothetical protein
MDFATAAERMAGSFTLLEKELAQQLATSEYLDEQSHEVRFTFNERRHGKANMMESIGLSPRPCSASRHQSGAGERVA